VAHISGKFGLEYNPRQSERDSSGLGWVFALVAAVALVSLVWTLAGRMRGSNEVAPEEQPPEPAPAATPTPTPAPSPTEPARGALAPVDAGDGEMLAKRPVKVRNLLMRLEEAERRSDVEMAVSTIEQLRALPGSPAADLDNVLARRLGDLNMKRLFVLKNAQWVKEVTVKRGDSASRIASENGSTLASLSRLNGGSVDRVILGSKLRVMNHPRFNLVVHRRSRTADLQLNGKFFKRYDLTAPVIGGDGAYEIPGRIRPFWAERGISFSMKDRAELEMLLPKGAAVLVSEF
jgi:hypothetical protein